jgi:diguanylate cyclase (GGDEF)-like protein/PAS domain S-box-containing protein
MLIKTKILLAITIVFLLHFMVVGYVSHAQIKQDVIEEIQAQARIVRGMLMALRRVYQGEFLSHDIPINEQTLALLPAHAITRLSAEFRNWVMNGVTFNNVSEQPRNPSNQADGVELEAIRYFTLHPEQQERLVPYTNGKGEAYFHYAQPIRVESSCLKCHGERDQVPEEIRKRYTVGYDYKVGELRGILSIKLPAKLFETRMAAQLKQYTLTHLAGLLFAFLLLSVLLNKTVIKPLVRLQQVTQRLYYGDYSVRAGMRYGSDEIARVSRMFDKMVVKLAERDKDLNIQRSLFAALAETNKLISRQESPEKLFEQVCRISIDYAEVSFAWIGLLSQDKKGLEPVASAADTGLPRILRVALDASKDGRDSSNPLIRAVTGMQVVVVDDLEKEQGALETLGETRPQQFRSAAFFPIIDTGKVLGSFNLYAREGYFFTPRIQELLEEMVADIAFAMQNFRRLELMAKAHFELEESNRQLSRTSAHLRLLLKSTGEGVFSEDELGYCTFINHAACETLGYTKEELVGQSIRDLLYAGPASQEHEPQEAYPFMQHWIAAEQGRRVIFRHKDGSCFPVEAASHPIYANDKRQGVVTVFRDVTEREAWHRKLNYLATHDHVTQLLNRFAFEDLLQAALHKTRANGIESVLCYLALDQIEVVNEVCGHLAGDAMLKLLAQTLSGHIKSTDRLARLGGDDFGLLLNACSLDEAAELAKRLCDLVKAFRFACRGKSFAAAINIGAVPIKTDYGDFSGLMSAVDAACYMAKEEGRNSVYVYRDHEQDLQKWLDKVRGIAAIRNAMQE